MKKLTLRYFKGSDGWRWNVASSNGKLVACSGESYKRKVGAVKGFASLASRIGAGLVKVAAIALVLYIIAPVVQAQDTNAPAQPSVASAPLAEWLPKEITQKPTTNAWAALFGKYAKRVSIGASDSFRLASDGTGVEHTASVSALYEFWQPVWTPKENWQVQFGVGAIVTYVPSWEETNVGAGASAAVVKLSKLQAIVDGTVVETVAPRLIVKVVVGLQLNTDELWDDKAIHGRGVAAITFPLN